ncbi:MAG TPA: cell division protein [Sphingomicrobium sp.]|nr:cell division protein [Sphingomicrobium sp.]
MFQWFFVSPAERRLLGASSRRAPTPWVIAIMSFTIMLIAATGLALANTAHVLSRGIQSRYALESPGGGTNIQRLVATLRSTDGISAVSAVPEAEMRRTLEKWLGPEAQSTELPVPALINFDAAPRANLNALEERARAIAPGSRVIAQKESVAPLLQSLNLLQIVSLGLVFLLSAAAAAAVVLAARGALDSHRFTIEVMHGVGATDLQVTHLFQRKIAIDACIGSVAGGAAAALVLLLLAGGAAFAGELTGGATLGLGDLIILAMLPLLLTVLATWVGRVAVLRALREAL